MAFTIVPIRSELLTIGGVKPGALVHDLRCMDYASTVGTTLGAGRDSLVLKALP
jgi:hypothetical protein